MGTKFYVTKHGYSRLLQKIDDLENRLKRTQSSVGEAADIGGNQWHDNSSYEQLVIDIRGQNKRLIDAHSVQNNCIVVEPHSNIEKAVIGTMLEILVNDVDKEKWGIVGYDESDLERNFIAYNTPLAKLLCGMKKDEEKIGSIAGRKVKVKIISIEIITDKHYQTREGEP